MKFDDLFCNNNDIVVSTNMKRWNIFFYSFVATFSCVFLYFFPSHTSQKSQES